MRHELDVIVLGFVFCSCINAMGCSEAESTKETEVCGCNNKVLDIIEFKGLIKTYEEGQPSCDREVTQKYSNSNYILPEKALKYLKRYKSYGKGDVISYRIIDRKSEPNNQGVSMAYSVTFRIERTTGKLIEINSVELTIINQR